MKQPKSTYKHPIVLGPDPEVDKRSGSEFVKEKLAKANEILDRVGLPDFEKIEADAKKKKASTH